MLDNSVSLPFESYTQNWANRAFQNNADGLKATLTLPFILLADAGAQGLPLAKFSMAALPLVNHKWVRLESGMSRGVAMRRAMHRVVRMVKHLARAAILFVSLPLVVVTPSLRARVYRYVGIKQHYEIKIPLPAPLVATPPVAPRVVKKTVPWPIQTLQTIAKFACENPKKTREIVFLTASAFIVFNYIYQSYNDSSRNLSDNPANQVPLPNHDHTIATQTVNTADLPAKTIDKVHTVTSKLCETFNGSYDKEAHTCQLTDAASFDHATDERLHRWARILHNSSINEPSIYSVGYAWFKQLSKLKNNLLKESFPITLSWANKTYPEFRSPC